MAASMDDLIATISSGMHVGQQANDLAELHAKLAQTLQHNTKPTRPIPPTTKTTGPHSSDGPAPPPAPVSSWNDSTTVASPTSHLLSSNKAWSSGLSNSPRQVAPIQFMGKRETGFVPSRPHHDEVLPSTASAAQVDGFAHDAFRPLFDTKQNKTTVG